MKSTIHKPTFGNIEEIDANLAKAESEGVIKLTPISENTGAMVECVDLKNRLSAEQIVAVYHALVRHKVLVFKKIGLNNEQQVRFTYELSEASPNIGAPTIGHTVFGHVENYPELYSIYQGPKTKPKDMERYEARAVAYPWTGYHQDITAAVNPPSIGMLRGEIIPEGVGDTYFGNLAIAYETLDEATKTQVAGLQGEHEYKFGKSTGTQAGDSISTRRMISHHPLVIVHPDSGEKILCNSPNFLNLVVGMSDEDSLALLHKIWAHSAEYTTKHVWDQGDLVIWDERSVTHKAPRDIYSSGKERQLYRTTLVGQPLVGLDGSVSEIVEGEPMLSCAEELASGKHEGRTALAATGNTFQSTFRSS